MIPVPANPDLARSANSAGLAAPAPSPRKPASPLHGLEYAALRGVDLLARALPLEVASRLSGVGWSVVARHLGRQRRAERHLAATMPELSAAERRRILLAMWRNLGETFVETLQADRLAAGLLDRIEIDPPCREILRRAVAEGGVVAAAHLGNWEAVAPLLTAAGANVVDVYQRVKNPLIDAYLFKIRKPFYTGGLLAKGEGAARGLVRQARDGGVTLHFADLREETGVAAPFFGRPAPSTPAPAVLARQFRRPLFALAILRVGACRFRLKAVEIEIPHGDDRAADIREATARIQGAFEGWIRRWPEQWMWAHRRYAPKEREAKPQGR